MEREAQDCDQLMTKAGKCQGRRKRCCSSLGRKVNRCHSTVYGSRRTKGDVNLRSAGICFCHLVAEQVESSGR